MVKNALTKRLSKRSLEQGNLFNKVSFSPTEVVFSCHLYVYLRSVSPPPQDGLPFIWAIQVCTATKGNVLELFWPEVGQPGALDQFGPKQGVYFILTNLHWVFCSQSPSANLQPFSNALKWKPFLLAVNLLPRPYFADPL